MKKKQKLSSVQIHVYELLEKGAFILELPRPKVFNKKFDCLFVMRLSTAKAMYRMGLIIQDSKVTDHNRFILNPRIKTTRKK